MARNVVFGLLMLSAATLIANPAVAEPSLHQVYQAAEGGKLSEAQTLMRDVLQAHPNSGKAHYVEAELLVKQGQLGKAESELATAERLAPGLPFAQPQSVQNLKELLGKGHSALPTDIQHASPLQSSSHESPSSFPWAMLLIGLALIAFIRWAVGFMSRRNTTPANGTYISPDNTFGAGGPATPYGMPPQPFGAGGVGAAGVPGQGLGSRVMSGLATGAAVGAGVVAGEALMHHFMDGNKENKSSNDMLDLGPSDHDSYASDLGGNDFGIADNSSWDDGSSGSDWN